MLSLKEEVIERFEEKRADMRRWWKSGGDLKRERREAWRSLKCPWMMDEMKEGVNGAKGEGPMGRVSDPRLARVSAASLPWTPEWAGHQWRDVEVREPNVLRAATVSATVEERMIVAERAWRADTFTCIND